MKPRLGAVLESVWPGLAGVVLVGIALANGSEAPALSVEEGAGVVVPAPAAAPVVPAAAGPAAADAARPARRAVAPAVEVDEDDERPGYHPPRRESEALYRLELGRLADQGPEALRAGVDAALAGDGVLAQKVAALQVAYGADYDGHLAPFHRVLWNAQSGAVLREFAVRFLARNARGDPEARAILAKAQDSPCLDLGRRCECLAAVLRWGRGDEVESTARRLLNETDLTVITFGVRALGSNDDPAAGRWIEEICSGHPDPGVREHATATRAALGREDLEDG